MTVCMEWRQEGKEITRGDQGKGGEGCSEGFSVGGRRRSQQRGKQERMQENVIRKFQAGPEHCSYTKCSTKVNEEGEHSTRDRRSCRWKK